MTAWDSTPAFRLVMLQENTQPDSTALAPACVRCLSSTEVPEVEPDHLEDVRGARCLPKAQNFQQSILLCLSQSFIWLKMSALTLMTHACHLRLYLLCDLATLTIGCALCNKMMLNEMCPALPALYYLDATVETFGPVIACLLRARFGV